MSTPTQIKFNSHDCTLMLCLPQIAVPPHIEAIAIEYGMQPKLEFHISVVVSDNARRVHALVDEFQQFSETLQNLETLAHAQDWEYEKLEKYSLHEEVYTSEKLEQSGKGDLPPHVRRTIIERIALPGMQRYYEGLSALFGQKFEAPPAHITLFSWSNYAPLNHRGVAISSEEEYQNTLIREL